MPKRIVSGLIGMWLVAPFVFVMLSSFHWLPEVVRASIACAVGILVSWHAYNWEYVRAMPKDRLSPILNWAGELTAEQFGSLLLCVMDDSAVDRRESQMAAVTKLGELMASVNSDNLDVTPKLVGNLRARMTIVFVETHPRVSVLVANYLVLVGDVESINLLHEVTNVNRHIARGFMIQGELLTFIEDAGRCVLQLEGIASVRQASRKLLRVPNNKTHESDLLLRPSPATSKCDPEDLLRPGKSD